MEGLGIAPELIDYHAYAVQSAPDEEVQARSVPKTAQEHRYHTVEVGIDLLPPVRTAPSRHNDRNSQQQRSECYPDVAAQYQGREGERGYPEVCAEGDVAVTAKGDVEVVLQPAAQADVPSLPEVGTVLGFVGRVEVARQVEAHEQRQADGNIRVAREVGIDLKGIEEEGCQVLKPCEKQGIGKDAVDEVKGEVVAQDYLLRQAPQYHEDGEAEHPAAQEVASVELRYEVARLDDRSGYELWEEADVEAEVEDVPYGTDKSAIDVGGIADDLEGVERDAYRQDDAVHAEDGTACCCVEPLGCDVPDLDVYAEDLPYDVCEEVAVLEVAEDAKVDGDAKRQP